MNLRPVDLNLPVVLEALPGEANVSRAKKRPENDQLIHYVADFIRQWFG